LARVALESAGRAGREAASGAFVALRAQRLASGAGAIVPGGTGLAGGLARFVLPLVAGTVLARCLAKAGLLLAGGAGDARARARAVVPRLTPGLRRGAGAVVTSGARLAGGLPQGVLVG